MKPLLFLTFLLLVPLIIGAEITSDNTANQGKYLNQSIRINSSSTGVGLFCDSYEPSDIERKLILPDLSLITINSPSFTAQEEDLSLEGDYIFECGSENETLVIEFNVKNQTPGASETKKMNTKILVVFAVLLGLIMIIVLVVMINKE